jgi:hypothetical protein
MPAKAMLFYVLATCSALARADRHVLVMAHSVNALDQNVPEPDEGSLEYSALDNWRTEAASQVDGVVSEEREKLDPAATEGINAAEKYAKMLNGLGNGLDTFKSAIGDFRAANKGMQGRQTEEVREMLQSARVESGATANATQTPVESEAAAGQPLDEAVEHEVEREEEVVPPEPHASPLNGSVVGSGAAANVTETPVTGQPLDTAAEREEEVVPQEPHASPLNGSVVGSGATANATEEAIEDASHEALKLTGHAENEATEEDAVESGSVVRQETSKEVKDAIVGLEKSLQSGELGDTNATELAVKNLVEEEEEQQARVTTACFALADSPLNGADRKCNSEVVKGIIEEKVCEDHKDSLKDACNAASKCQTKHVCLRAGAVVADNNSAWEVHDDPSCEAGDPEMVCVPKVGSFRLPART